MRFTSKHDQHNSWLQYGESLSTKQALKKQALKEWRSSAYSKKERNEDMIVIAYQKIHNNSQ